MSLTQLAPPYPVFTDKSGDPLDAGFLYFGEVNQNPETNPIQVYWDAALTQPAAQPIRTINGYPSRNGTAALIYADSQFSVTVRNKRNELVIYSPAGLGIIPNVPSTFATSDRVVKNVATLLADVQFTYTPGIPNTIQVSSGDIIRTLAEGFAYEVAASGASDQDVSTAGGVKLYVQANANGFDARAFGAIGDGVTDDTAAINSALAKGGEVYGFGLTFNVSSLPASFENIRKAAFKVGYVTHVTKDFLPLDTAKITNTKLYAAWPQDSSYVVVNQIRMWAKYADSHVDPDVRAALWTSDDGGVSWQEPELLDEASNGETTMCAGTDGTYEYVFTYQYGSPTYWMHKRTAPVQGSNFYAAFTKTSMTIPKPSGFTADPLYVHSFASNFGIITLGVTSGDGAWLIYSNDQGATWTPYALQLSPDAEEPTVKWWAAGNKWVGFIRAGTTAGRPQFYTAPADFSSAPSLYPSPATFFGPIVMADSPIPLVVDGNKIYAFGSYRSGTEEGNARDKDTSAFYVTADLSDGENIWLNASTNNYRLGNLIHTETGGSSAVGVGSVVKYEDKIFLLYSQDERTGTFPATGSTTVPTDRVANIYQTVIPLSFTDGVIDFNNKLVSDRSANNPFVRRQGGKAWMAKEGRWLFSISGQLSDSYANAKVSTYNDFIVDLYSTTGSVTVATDSIGKSGFAVYNDYGTGGENGFLVDGGNGNLNFYVDGTERFRWNESALSFRPNADDAYALGGATFRWSEVFAGTGTINTSDANLKEQVADLDAAELAVAQRIKSLIKKFKFKNAVQKKGDDARIHVGVMAHDVKAAFEAEGLDAHAYGMFCENTETDENGTEITRLGVRYSELLAFVISAM